MDISKVDDPNELTELTPDELYALPDGEIEEFRLRAARRSFEELRPRVQFLDRLAKNQGVDELAKLDDLVPILFAHTAYKSYPMSLLEKGRFDRLTQWLGQLTTHDLSHVDVSGISTIEDWVLLLDDVTPLRLATSSATSGRSRSYRAASTRCRRSTPPTDRPRSCSATSAASTSTTAIWRSSSSTTATASTSTTVASRN